MSVFSLEGRIDRSAEHNDILPLLLGLLKILDEVDQGTHKKASLNRSDAPDERVVLAVLGVLSLRHRLNRWVQQCVSARLVVDEGRTGWQTLEKSLWR